MTNPPQKLPMHTPDLTKENIAKLAELFPHCVTETHDAKNQPTMGIDFDLLKQELSFNVIDDSKERYQINWPGKRAALHLMSTPIEKTLRPREKESVDWDTTQNLFIEGDNLDALKLLGNGYLGKVKMIYIDPPYNTGNDFIYKDSFKASADEHKFDSGQADEEGNRLVINPESNGRFHSDWLSMMYPRLKLAKNMLREDGVIFISIDDHEQANLKRLCDEVFGEDNFLATLVWKKKYTGGRHTKGYVDLHEYVCVYAKSLPSLGDISIDRPEDEKAKFSESDEYQTERGKFYVRPLKSNLELRRTLIYPITAPDGSILETQWLVAKNTFDKLLKEKRVEFRKKQDGTYQIYKKYYEKDGGGTVKPPSLIDKYPNTEAKGELKKLFDVKEGRDNVFYTVKPLNLIKHLIAPHDKKDAIILDFFAGSGTTAHAVMELNAKDGGNRKFICVQLPEVIDEKSPAFIAGFKTITEISKERIRRAGKKILENSCHPDWNKDIGFRVLALDSTNMEDVYYHPAELTQEKLAASINNIKDDRSELDLLFQTMLDYGLDLSLPITEKVINNGRVFCVDTDTLVACFERSNVVSEDFCKTLARMQPERVVFRDASFESSAVKISVVGIFKVLSPKTDIKVL